MNTFEMIAALEQMLAYLKGVNPPADLAAPASYPRVEVIQGAQFDLKAPVNPAWQPSQYARMFGRNMVLNDPSNAAAGQPLRSPAGYPLVYLIPGKPARVLYAESTYDDDAQVERYRVAEAESRRLSVERDEREGYDFSPGGR
jgi:hypothetical protein